MVFHLSQIICTGAALRLVVVMANWHLSINRTDFQQPNMKLIFCFELDHERICCLRGWRSSTFRSVSCQRRRRRMRRRMGSPALFLWTDSPSMVGSCCWTQSRSLILISYIYCGIILIGGGRCSWIVIILLVLGLLVFCITMQDNSLLGWTFVGTKICG